MRIHRALLLVAVFALSPLDAVAEEKQIVGKGTRGELARLGLRSGGRRMGGDERLGRRKLQGCDHEFDDPGEILSSNLKAAVLLGTNDVCSNAISRGARDRECF